MTHFTTHSKEFHLTYERPSTWAQEQSSDRQMLDILKSQVELSTNDVERMARNLMVRRTQELMKHTIDWALVNRLYELFEWLMDFAEHHEDCTCKPDGDACYFCRKVGEAKRILGGEA